MKIKHQQACVLGGFRLDEVDYKSGEIIEAHPKLIKSLGTAVDVQPEALAEALKAKDVVIKKHEWVEPVTEAEGVEEKDNLPKGVTE